MKKLFRLFSVIFVLTLMLAACGGGGGGDAPAQTPLTSSSKDITSFTILGVSGTMSPNTVAVTVPFGTDPSSLTPTMTHTGASVSPASGVAQNFTNPVTYTVTAADGSTKTYTVTVTVALNSAKDITSFTILGIPGTIVGTNISLTVPNGTIVTGLIPTITITGATVDPASLVAQDFTNTVTYTVTAADGSTKAYFVTVTVAGISDKDITSFTILGIPGAIDQALKTIKITVPSGTDLSSLIPTIVKTGVSVSPLSGVANDFTTSQIYTVTAADASTKAYFVTVTAAGSSAKNITKFTILGIDGTITEGPPNIIAVTVPHGTILTALTPTITITGVSVNPNSGVGQDFTNPVTYTVTADDASTKAYTVTVTAHKCLYAANAHSNTVSAYTIDQATGALTPVAGSPWATGTQPWSVAVDRLGKFAYTGNQGTQANPPASVSEYTIDQSTGALTPVAGSPLAGEAGARWVAVHPKMDFAYVANIGANNISAYSINPSTGALTPVAGSPFAAGTNPNSVTVDPLGKFAYVSNQNSGNISAYTIDQASGALTPVAGSPFASGTETYSVTVDPSGKFAYAANEKAGENNIWAYTIAANGALTPVAGSPFAAGTQPVYVAFHPSLNFAYVANYGSDTIFFYTIDANGALTKFGEVAAGGIGPIFIAVDPSGNFAYVAIWGSHDLNDASGKISVFKIEANGALTPVAGSPFAAGLNTVMVGIQ